MTKELDMRRISCGMSIAVLTATLFVVTPVRAQVSGATDVNLTQKTGDDSECAIAKNPLNKLQLFALCNTASTGLLAMRSTDGGATWTYPDPADKTIADGDAGQGPAACCDPNLAWDSFGNLFLTYIDAGVGNIVTIMSTDAGLTFTNVISFPGSVDQPTVVAANTRDPAAPVALWIVWNQSGSMVARGAPVTGLGAVGTFTALQNIPGTASCSFGDLAVSVTGAVVQACGNPSSGQGPSTIRVNIDADGLGAGNFGATIAATTTNVGGFDFIPAQNARSVDPEAGLAYDTFGASPHFGRLYLVYTEETAAENNDLDIMLRFSDNDGATWSAPIRVNDDATTRSQFLPKIAVNPLSGNIGVCWYDARNSATNTAAEIYCSVATRLTPTPVFFPSVRISDGASTSNGAGIEFGDYDGLTYFQGLLHPIWADISNSTGDNPNTTANFDAYTDRVSGGTGATEGDPHVTTVSGVHYDFQAAGEFVALRDGEGMEIQVRHTPVETTFTPGPDPYSGIATKVSVNTAVAAKVGTHRVTYQPNISGVPDPSGLQLRIDGVLTTLGPDGRDLGSGGRVAKAPAGDGIVIDFPNGTALVVTPGWWASQSKWYLNVNAYHTPALEGVMGAILPRDWLPLLPNGASLGPKPATVDQRFKDLYITFADAWRVTRATSLFDYGADSARFCIPAGWPKETAECVGTDQPRPTEISLNVAQTLCAPIRSKSRQADCIFDLRATGERAFARTYQIGERIEQYATAIVVSTERDSSSVGKPLTVNVAVMRKSSRGLPPRGRVQAIVDGERAGQPAELDARGRALVKLPILKPGTHRIAAIYTPDRESGLLASRSLEIRHVVGGTPVR
jgi:hypothetical protein